MCVCRRQDQVHTHNGDRPQMPNGDIGMDIGHLQLGAQKRGASPTPESVTEDERVAKRSRRVSGQAEGPRQSGETHGARNPIDVSYSSSRRWFDRKVSLCHCVCHCVCHWVTVSLCHCVCYCVSQCVTVCHCVSLCVTVCHCVSLCVTVCHCVSLCVSLGN